MNAAEQRYVSQDRTDTRVFRSLSGLKVQTYAFDGPPYLGFLSSHDVWGDGSIVLVPAPGHTPGSIIAFVALPTGKRYALIGDLTWQLDGIEARVERPLLMRALADDDPGQVRQDLLRIVALATSFKSCRHMMSVPIPASLASPLVCGLRSGRAKVSRRETEHPRNQGDLGRTPTGRTQTALKTRGRPAELRVRDTSHGCVGKIIMIFWRPQRVTIQFETGNPLRCRGVAGGLKGRRRLPSRRTCARAKGSSDLCRCGRIRPF
jgi:hypothetical protein